MKFNREQGFTLIELLVVIAILGILAAVVIPAVTNFIGEGETESAQTELHNVELAVASLMADPSVPVRDLVNDNRIDGIQACADPPENTTCEPDTPNLGNAANGCSNNVDETVANPPPIIDVADAFVGNSATQMKRMEEYMTNDTTEHYYCVEADGTTHGWLTSDGTYIKDL